MRVLSVLAVLALLQTAVHAGISLKQNVCIGRPFRVVYNTQNVAVPSSPNHITVFDKKQLDEYLLSKGATCSTSATCEIDLGSLKYLAAFNFAESERSSGIVYFETLALKPAQEISVMICSHTNFISGFFKSSICAQRVDKIVLAADDALCKKANAISINRIPIGLLKHIPAYGDILVSHLAVDELNAGIIVDSVTRSAESGENSATSASLKVRVLKGGVVLSIYLKSPTPCFKTEGFCRIEVIFKEGTDLLEMSMKKPIDADFVLASAAVKADLTNIDISLAHLGSACSLELLRRLASAPLGQDTIFDFAKSVAIEQIQQLARSLSGYTATDPCFQRHFVSPVQDEYNQVAFSLAVSYSSQYARANVVLRSPLVEELLGRTNGGQISAALNVDPQPDHDLATVDYKPDVSVVAALRASLLNELLVTLTNAEALERLARANERLFNLLIPLQTAFMDQDFMNVAMLASSENSYWTFSRQEASGFWNSALQYVFSVDRTTWVPQEASERRPILNLPNAQVKCAELRQKEALQALAAEQAADPENKLLDEVIEEATDVLHHKPATPAPAPAPTTELSFVEVFGDDKWQLDFLTKTAIKITDKIQFHIRKVLVDFASLLVEFKPLTAVEGQTSTGEQFELVVRTGRPEGKDYGLDLSAELGVGAPPDTIVEGEKHIDIDIKMPPNTELFRVLVTLKPQAVEYEVKTEAFATALDVTIQYVPERDDNLLVRILETPLVAVKEGVAKLASDITRVLRPKIAEQVRFYLARISRFTFNHPCTLATLAEDSGTGSVLIQLEVRDAVVKVGTKFIDVFSNILRAHVPYALRESGFGVGLSYAESSVDLKFESTVPEIPDRQWHYFIGRLMLLIQGAVSNNRLKATFTALGVFAEMKNGVTAQSRDFWASLSQTPNALTLFEPVPRTHTSFYLNRACSLRNWESFKGLLDSATAPTGIEGLVKEKELQYVQKRLAYETTRLAELQQVETIRDMRDALYGTQQQIDAADAELTQVQTQIAATKASKPRADEAAAHFRLIRRNSNREREQINYEQRLLKLMVEYAAKNDAIRRLKDERETKKGQVVSSLKTLLSAMTAAGKTAYEAVLIPMDRPKATLLDTIVNDEDVAKLLRIPMPRPTAEIRGKVYGACFTSDQVAGACMSHSDCTTNNGLYDKRDEVSFGCKVAAHRKKYGFLNKQTHCCILADGISMDSILRKLPAQQRTALLANSPWLEQGLPTPPTAVRTAVREDPVPPPAPVDVGKRFLFSQVSVSTSMELKQTSTCRAFVHSFVTSTKCCGKLECPFSNGVCCPEGTHCCPNGSVCLPRQKGARPQCASHVNAIQPAAAPAPVSNSLQPLPPPRPCPCNRTPCDCRAANVHPDVDLRVTANTIRNEVCGGKAGCDPLASLPFVEPEIRDPTPKPVAP